VREPEAAVAIVVAAGESVLLIRRTERDDDPWSGHWSLPGGRVEVSDPTPADTALRELAEECGILLDRASLAAELPPMLARRRTGPYLPVAPFTFTVSHELPATVDPEEAVEALWVSLRMLRDPMQHRLQSVPGMPAHALFPTVDLTGPPLWGFTYRLLTTWLGLNPQAPPAPGFWFADQLLRYLVSPGRPLLSDWNEERAATIGGPFPTDAARAWMTAPGPRALAVNRVDLHPDAVRIAGLEYEEYSITAAG
jgi:8-oxo-dGTP diphosphatase